MDQINESFAGINSTSIMWIASGMATMFVAVVVADALRHRSKRRGRARRK